MIRIISRNRVVLALMTAVIILSVLYVAVGSTQSSPVFNASHPISAMNAFPSMNVSYPWNNSTNGTAIVNQIIHRIFEWVAGIAIAVAAIIGLIIAIRIMTQPPGEKMSEFDRLKSWIIGMVLLVGISSGLFISVFYNLFGV